MQFKVSRDGHVFGTLSFDGSIHHFLGDTVFNIKLADMIRDGVSLMQDIVHDDQRWIIDDPIEPDDLRFPVAVVEHLRRRGYRVDEIHPELELLFKKIISKIPADTALFSTLTGEWQRMTYLQKTEFLATLKSELKK